MTEQSNSPALTREHDLAACHDVVKGTSRQPAITPEKASFSSFPTPEATIERVRAGDAVSIREWQKIVFANAKAKGFHEYESPPSVERMGLWMALLTSEVSEALECIRYGEMREHYAQDGKPLGLPSELADIAIRLMDSCEALGIDLESAIREKHLFNMTRPNKHGGKLA